jgi:predicted DNA binding CopG/RHH family protein
MRKAYDFKGATPNPYADHTKRTVTIRLEDSTIRWFKGLSEEMGIPYQTLINLYLRDCVVAKRKLALRWRPGA